MSGSIVHHATVDKGLKMKIKRKNVSLDKSDKQKKDNSKLETAKTETKAHSESGHNANGMLADKGNKLSLFTDKEKSPKSKNSVNKKDKGKALVKGDGGSTCGVGGSTLNGGDNLFSQNTMEPKLGETATGKKECMPDPYEFNAKVEDGFSVPMKKMKIDKEKGETASASSSISMTHLPSMGSPPQDVSTDTCDMAVSTEPECLGPCEPGTHVNLEGIVWHESDNGVLVVNVTWRGKTYVGTLLDATRHDWAPPRLNCDSPTGEFESRTPKGRGKRRGASNTPVNDTRTLRKGRRGSQQTFTAPPSPAKSDVSVGGIKRKGRPQDIDLSATDQRGSKRSRSGSQAATPNSDTPPTDSQGYIECPEPNCNKKYRHANGLKYHQSHAHSGSNMSLSADDSRDIDTEDMPLSVVKSAVKKEKEKEIKKESNKKDSGKDSSSPISDKSNKVETKSDKVDKDAKDSESESKDSVSKSDAKCDSASKKKECGGKQTVSNNNGKASSILPNSSSKSSTPSATSSPSSQTNSASNSVIAASQSASASSGTSSSAISNSSNSGSAAPVSNTVTNSPSASEAGKMDNKLVDIKPKIPSEMRAAKSNRPIVPAPSPQVLGNVQVTHSNLSPVMSHTQMSPRPIQPKPTIMGETQNINPALADLNKDRKKMQKKKTLKEGAGLSSGNRNDQPTVKIERTGVIKTNPLPHKHTDQSNKKDSGAKDGQRPQGPDPQRSQTQGSHKALDMSHSKVNNNNMNMLKVGSPLQVATPDNHHKAALNEDVQSPAYSDISDANESASPAGPSDVSPQKHKEESSGGKKDETVVKSEPMTSPQQQPLQQTEGGQMMQHYGMPPYYYGQSPYGMNMSPSQKTSTPSGSGNVSSVPSSNSNQKENMKGASSDDKKPAVEDTNKGDKKQQDEMKERDNQNRPKGMPPQGMHPHGGPGSMPSNLSPQQMADFKMQQNFYQQMYIQSLPPQLQYQYMANGWYPPVDPAYMQQVMEDQRRGEPGRPERDGAMPSGPGTGAEGGRERGPDMKGQPGPGGPLQRKDDGNSGQRPLPSPGQSGLIDRNDSGKNNGDDKSMKDQALREKQNENHQILKENIDLKYEMDKNRQEYMERMRMQNAEERRRMYQEQKMIEERKKMELSARKGESRAGESVTSKPPGTKPVVEHSPRTMLPGQQQQRPLEDGHREIKRENFDRKDGRDSYIREGSSGKYSESTNKCSDEKSRTPVSDKHRSDSAYRNPETPKHRPGGSSSKSGSPSTSLSSSVPGSPSYSPYLNNYPPYNPKFLGMDPMYRNHNVNPAMISGYQGYIHPSQMGYRPSPGDEKDTKSAQKSVPSPSPVSDSELKKSGELANRGGPYYGNMHKIHELTEKARPRSRNSSPSPVTSSASYDKHRDYTNSPPTQRHVHTHHHTHVLQPGPGLPPAPGIPAPLYDPYNAGKF